MRTGSITTGGGVALGVWGVALLSGAAGAQVEFHLDGRIRFEQVDQAGISDEAQGVTARHRFGVSSRLSDRWSVLAEGEHVFALVDDFNDTINGQTRYPVIADPDAFELNRLQLGFSHDAVSATLGRQRLVIADSRYVGNVGYRQNEQTFDAVRVSAQFHDRVTLDYAYLDRVNRIFGPDSAMGDWELDSHLLVASAEVLGGEARVTGLLFDNEDVPGLSSETWAVYWGASRPLGEGEVRYFVEYAQQGDYADNPAAFDLDALRGEVRFTSGRFGVWAGAEQLEGNGSRGFATPLATLHKFQGFADAFLTTPATGLQDVYLGGSVGLGDGWGLSAPRVQLIWHAFDAEQGGADLGSELDLVFTGRLTQTVGLMVKYADYDSGDAGPASREKLAIMLNYSF
ncbi:hypothetical protein RMQ97_13175 [Maricaulis sp. D1M11]|uniref:hypothetical protein n=1 Tax=Maricaulis sp. D1M11 TaxID=3076117 RepID=UPI0039B52C9F